MGPVIDWFRTLPRRIVRGFIRGYQAIIGPHLPPSCRYTPSCSNYAVQAVEKYGAVKGSILTVWRLLHCHPLGGHGYDPPRWFGETVPSNDLEQPSNASTSLGIDDPSSDVSVSSSGPEP